MSFDADYGGDLRHYDAVKFADDSSRQTVNHRHHIERCQFSIAWFTPASIMIGPALSFRIRNW